MPRRQQQQQQQQASKREPMSLFDEEADENDDVAAAALTGQLAVNKNYAERYNNWRGKEEMQKLKDKYGDVGLNENSEEEESESETEDEDAQELTKDVELEFFRALSLLKSKDKKIYDKENTKFFEAMQNGDGDEDKEEAEGGPKGRESKDKDKDKAKAKKKPYQLKDLEREMVLKRMSDAAKGVSIDEDYEEAGELRKDQQLKSQTTKMSYFEEQEDIKRSLKKAMASAGSDEEEEEEASGAEGGGLLTVKQKSKEQAEREEAEYIEWFKGQKADIGDEEIKKSMGSLHDFWTDPALPESEKFLRDYILNKRYIDGGEDESGSDEDTNEQAAADPKEPVEAKKAAAAAGEVTTLDFVDLSDEEKIIEHQEEFERKYNFRFEEPDPEFIKAYPRTIQDSMRREKTKRREKREETKKRKELEKTQRREEIKRLKNLKRLEIVDKLERLKKVAGLKAEQGAKAAKGLAGLSEKDLEADFDPDEYERRMQELFDDDYYGGAEGDAAELDDNEKPVFTDDEDEDLKILNWDQWETEEKPKLEEERKLSKKERKALKKKRKEQEEAELEDPEFDMDAEPEPEETAGSKKMSKLAKALLKKKPVFDPAGDKTFDEYFDEYYQLDCEDVIGGDLPCRFKYREVVPNDFGLDLEEIFGAKDQELNQWASLKKTTQYRPIKDEVNDVRVYKSKRNQMDLKKRILSSLYNPVEEEEEPEAEAEVEAEVEAETEAEVKPDKGGEAKAETAVEEAETESGKKKAKKRKRDKELVAAVEEVGEPIDESVAAESNETRSKKSKKQAHHSKPKKNKNILESMSADRLQAYGIEPKKFHKKLKYGGKEADQKAAS